MSIKKKIAATCWNAFVDAIPILLPLVIEHKTAIIKKAKKIKLK